MGALAFNGDVTNFNVSSAYGLGAMFQNAQAFDQDISGWDVSNVVITEDMFNGAELFRQNLCAWGNKLNPIGARLDERMFLGTDCISLDSPDLNATPAGPFCFTC